MYYFKPKYKDTNVVLTVGLIVIEYKVGVVSTTDWKIMKRQLKIIYIKLVNFNKQQCIFSNLIINFFIT